MATLEELLAGYGLPQSGLVDFGMGELPELPAAPVRRPGYLSGFLQSVAGTVPEMVGLEPDTPFSDAQDVRSFRNENPIGSFISQALGYVVPVGASARVGAAGLRTFAPGVVKSLGTLAKTNPFRARAAQEVVSLLPFEAGRLAIGSMVAPENLGETAFNAGLDLVLAPAIGVGLQFGRSLLGTPRINKLSDEIKKVFPDFNNDASRQEQLLQLQTFSRNADATIPPAVLDNVGAFTQRLSREIRDESIPRPVGPLANGADPRELRRVFTGRGESDSSVISRKFIVSPKHFATTADWQAAAKEAGLPEGFESAVQFPRLVTLKTRSAQRQVGNMLSDRLDEVQDGWLLQREANDGLFVMAKRLRSPPSVRGAGGQFEPSGAPVRWVVLKTNDPDRLIGRTVFGESVARKTQFANNLQVRVDAGLTAQSELATMASKWFNDVPWRNFALPGAEGFAKSVGEMLPKGLKNASKSAFDAKARAFKFAAEYVAPAMQQFARSPRAGWTWQSARTIFDLARARGDAAMYGPQGLKGRRSLFGELFARGQPGGIFAKIEALSADDLPVVTNMLMRNLPPEAIEAAGASPAVRELFALVAAEDAKRAAEMGVLSRLTGAQVRALSPQEYSVARSWRGEWRLELRDQDNRLLEMASGNTPDEAFKNAREIQLYYKMNNRKLLLPERKPFLSTHDEDLDWARMMDYSTRLTTQPPNINPLSKKQLSKVIKSHITTDNLRMAEMLSRHLLSPSLMKLASEDYGTFKQLSTRMGDLAQRPGKFSKFQNELVDKVLGKVLGKNSATKLVAFGNEIMFHFSLGALNLMFPALNVAGLIQTTLPHLAFVKNAVPARLAQFYTQSLVMGAEGRPRGLMSALSPLKIMGQTFKLMANPNDELRLAFGRAASDNLVTAGFTEEFLGQQSNIALKMKSVRPFGLNGGTGIFEYLGHVSKILPTMSERFSRGFSFVAGYQTGRNWMGLEGEQLYQFAKQFTQRTMYMYSTADRPRVLTGPLGSSFGLFKNWLFHNMADWSNYTAEGFLRGNFAPLLWSFGGTAALGGVGALPLFGLADGASRILSDKSILEHLYAGFGYGDDTSAVDSVYFGIPAFLGVSMQASASGPFSNPARDFEFLYNWALVDQGAKAVKFLGHMHDQWFAQGVNPLVDDRAVDLMAYAFGPRTFYKGMAQVENGALKSIRNGRPVVEGVTNLEYVMNTLSLTPLKIAKAYELSEQLWSEKNTRDALQATYGEAWYEASTRGDSKAMQDILEKATARGLSLASIFKSSAAKQRLDAGEGLDNDFKSIVDASLRRTQMGIR